LAQYYINGQLRLEYNVGSSPDEITKMSVMFSGNGWWTGHYHHFDDIIISQDQLQGDVTSPRLMAPANHSVIDDPTTLRFEWSPSFSPNGGIEYFLWIKELGPNTGPVIEELTYNTFLDLNLSKDKIYY